MLNDQGHLGEESEKPKADLLNRMGKSSLKLDASNLKDTGAKVNAPRIEVKHGQVSGVQTVEALNVGAAKGAAPGEVRAVGLATKQKLITLSNGANNDVAIANDSFVRISGPATAYSITGFDSGRDGALLFVENDTTQNLTLANQNAGSTAANRIITQSGADVTITGRSIAQFIYDSNASRWQLMNTWNGPLISIPYFGDGSDGDLSTTGNVTLTRDMNYNNLTVNAGHTVFNKGFKIRVKGTLTIAATGAIDCSGGNGGNGSGSTGGSAGAAGFTGNKSEVCTPGAGGAGATASGSPGAQAGAGGVGGSAAVVSSALRYDLLSGAGGGGGGAIDATGGGVAGGAGGNTAFGLSSASNGGTGGSGLFGGTADTLGGGGGGGGGGPVPINANTINNAGTIKSNGGNGGNGQTGVNSNSGNGSGGSGGVVLVNYRSTTGSGVGTLSAAAGVAGTGGNGGANGGAGTTASFQI